jgi:hypothetical protein
MGLTVGTNSWVTVTEADNYLADTFGADGWAPLGNTLKEQLLISAFRWIFNYPGATIPKTSTNEKVKSAQIELAWWIKNYWAEYEKRQSLIAGGVTDFELSKWMEKLGTQDLPQNILNILIGVLTDLGGVFPTFERTLEN